METRQAAVYDVDLYDDDVLIEPYAHYRRLRDLAPAVYCPRNDLWAVARFEDVRACLRNPHVFSSARGVAACPATNAIAVGNLLASDPPEHEFLRTIVSAPLGLSAVRELQPRIEAEAEDLVDRLVAQGAFDAVEDLAWHLPLKVVSDLVGLPEEGRENMLKWAAATFDALGGDNARSAAALPITQEMRRYVTATSLPSQVKPDSWAARIFERGARGELPIDKCPVLLRDYLGPSLDTTIFATANLIWLFGRFPEQWDLLRADHSLIPAAINECIRLESPIRGFTRFVTEPATFADVTVPAGARVLLLYASANRDERKWERAEDFDVRRKSSDHLGFGNGIHSCAGMHLARLEMTALLKALLPRVSRFEIGHAERAINNVLRGLAKLPVTVH